MNVVEQILDEISQKSLHKIFDPVLVKDTKLNKNILLSSLFMLTLKNVSMKSTKSSKIQSKGPRPLISISMDPR